MKKSILILFLFLTLLNCQKEINFELPAGSYESNVFIECILIPGEIPKAFVSQSLPFFNPDVTPQQVFARGATVSITDSNGNVDMLLSDSTFDKFRCRWVPFYSGIIPSEYGESYDLKVIFEGEEYSASTTIDQAKITLDTVTYTSEFFDIYGGHDGVVITFQDAIGPGNFYRFQMDRWIDKSRAHAHILEVVLSECTDEGEKFFVSDYGRTIFNDENIDGQILTLNLEVSWEYLKGDSATVYMMSLDKKAANFYQDLDDQLASILNPFVEPVFLDSKIDDAIGVFGSAVYSDPWLFIYPRNNP